MKCIVAALALASLSYVGVATAAPASTVNVNVTNPVLPVEISNAGPIPVSTAPSSVALAKVKNEWIPVSGNAPSNYVAAMPITAASTLNGLSIQLFSKAGATSFCSVEILVKDGNGGLAGRLGRWGVSAGRDATVSFVPFNISIPAGYSIEVELGNDFSDNCSSLTSVYTTMQ